MPPLNIPHKQVQYLEQAKPGISRTILDEGWLASAYNTRENPAMMALFDIYMECLPGSSHLDNETCYTCRGKVLSDFQLMVPYLKHAAGLVPVEADFRDVSYRQMFEETLNVKL